MSIQQAPIEIFYSYADADEDLRSELDKHLSQLSHDGLITTWHKRHLTAGQDWTKLLDQHLNTASVILLLVSSDFLASDYCYGIEVQRAMERHEAGEARVIPLILRPVDWQTAPFGKLQPLPSQGTPITEWHNRDMAFADIARGIRAVLIQHLTVSAPSAMASGIWNVPYLRNPHFTGRDELLDHLDRQLSSIGQDDSVTIRRAALTQPQAIKGLGGIGKTQIAVEYAYRSRDLDRYTHTFWINAASEEALLTSFTTLAELLPAFPSRGEADQRKLVEAIKHWLEQCKQRWLLIFDNADTVALVRDYLPQRGNGSVLLTTRADAVGSLATSVEVEVMSFIEGTHLLLRRAQRFEQASDEEVNEAGNIVVALDHFPLALDQAGAYIEETKCRFVDYLQIYQNHRQALLARRGTQMMNYPDSVATTWSLSFQRVEQANLAAADLLRLFAFLAPDRIPEELIRDGAAYWTPLLQKAVVDLFDFNQMIEELLKFSLIKRLAEDNMISIHRLVQEVQKDRMMQDEQHAWAERVVRAVSDVFPHDPKEVASWSQCLRYLEQAQACDILIQHYMFLFVEAATLLNRAGTYLREHALYSIAEPIFQRALSISEQHLDTNPSDTAKILSNLLILYGEKGMYEQAELLCQRALSINEQCLGAEHPDTVMSLHNLALLYWHQGKYELAEPLFQRVLAIHEQQLGPEHCDTAKSLSGLALLYWYRGKYELAEPLFRRALAIWEQQLGAEHPDTAMGLNNLACLHNDQEKYELAEPLFRRALAIWEQQLGAEHPDVAQCLNNLALIYSHQEKYEQAEPLYQRALAIGKKAYGPEHPDIANHITNLAELYQHQRKYEQAEGLYQQALAINEQSLGVQHPFTADSLSGLAELYREQGKYEQAEAFYQRALTIREQGLGQTHPDTQETRKAYASLLRLIGRDAEAMAIEAKHEQSSEEHA